jgi:hypothetical protein
MKSRCGDAGLGADDVIDYREHSGDLIGGLAAAGGEDMRYDMVYDTVTSLDPADTNYTGQSVCNRVAFKIGYFGQKTEANVGHFVQFWVSKPPNKIYADEVHA